ncbi:4-hydroxy-3-methylbut-2-enyl diphosphate reductase, partial [uncultured Holdemanella sp.]|uniref:4-hydroxy-3-methylbut-2-enyl diphosphate reductase n=1 Tax=uncultured Holdemanella sp. TaxID=1763549 RepID=UPI0025CF5A81
MKTQNIITVKPQGYCGGVLKAIETAKNTRIQYPNKKITILGNLVHNQYVKKALQYYSIDTIEDKTKTRYELLDEINEGIVIFTAHGVSPKVYKKAKDKGLILIDASCPFVLQTQKIVKKYLDEDYTIFYIGKNKHPEAESIYTMSDHVYLIEPHKDIPKINTSKIFVTNQTTMSIYELKDTFEKIKSLYPFAIFHDEICNATRVRQQAILNLKNVDCLIVVGDPTSNNSQKLVDIGKKAGIQDIFSIQTVEDIDKKDFVKYSTIAITSGASTPTYLTN